MTGGKSRAFIAGSIWMLVGRGGTQLANLLIQMVLARILTPADFGSVAISMSILATLMVFAEMGTSAALVRDRDLKAVTIDSALVLTFIGTTFLCIVLYLTSDVVAHWYSLDSLAPLLRLVSCSYFFRGLFSLQRCLLLRQMKFKAITSIELGGIIASGLISVPLAFQNFGASSILWGQVFASFFCLAAGAALVRHRPKTLGTRAEMKRLFSFGMWVSLSRALGAASGQFDKLLLGFILSPAAVGVYYLGQRIATLLSTTITGLLDQVAFPIYSSMNDSPGKIETAYRKTVFGTAVIILPISAVLVIAAEPLIQLFFGDQWAEAAPVLKILAIAAGIQSLGGGVFNSVVLSLGKPQVNVIISIFRLLILPVCVWIGSYWGLLGVAWGVVGFGVLGRLFNQAVLSFYFKFSIFDFFEGLLKPLFSICVLGSLVAMIVPRFFGHSHFLDLIYCAIVSILVFGSFWGTLFIFCPQESKQMSSQLRGLFSSRWRTLKRGAAR